MKHNQNWLGDLDGWLGADAYSTAWVALVPARDDPNCPAWPQALDYLRTHQLEDGGWGEPHVYFAHERTISTLAAIKALHTWQTLPSDARRIERGLAALRHYADNLAGEPHEPIGFELLLPRLRDDLIPFYGRDLPLDRWHPVEVINGEKLALIQHLQPDPASPQTWWLSLEMLPEEHLARLDDSMLRRGSIATAPAATAAYLAARRQAGEDSPGAARYLDWLLRRGDGGVPFCWPAEIFEQVWGLDGFKRAGLDPRSQSIAPVVENLRRAWYRNTSGLSYNNIFPVNDGDDTLLGYAVLCWAGAAPSDDSPIMSFFNGDHFSAYVDERGASHSVNIHALSTLREQPGFPHRDAAEKVSQWLIAHMKDDVIFDDKWHLSPLYSVAHAIPAFAGWDNGVASRCIDFLLERQRNDGGWGDLGPDTLEETAHCVIGLSYAYMQGLLSDDAALMKAGRYFEANAERRPVERLWIGKTLYHPRGIVEATLFSAKVILARLGFMSMKTAA